MWFYNNFIKQLFVLFSIDHSLDENIECLFDFIQTRNEALAQSTANTNNVGWSKISFSHYRELAVPFVQISDYSTIYFTRSLSFIMMYMYIVYNI